MFKVALTKDPRCPFYDHVPGGLWNGQWGFLTDSTEMRSQIAMCISGMEASGWMKPLDPAAAKATMKEVLESLVLEEAKMFSTTQRPVADAGLDAIDGSWKRARTDAAVGDVNSQPEVTDSEISAIAVEATLEVSVSP